MLTSFAARCLRTIRHELVYVRNRLVSLSNTQPTLIGEEFPSASNGAAVFPRDMCEEWDVGLLEPGVPAAHPDQDGLWFIPALLSQSEREGVVGSVSWLTEGDATQGKNGTPVQARCAPAAVAAAASTTPRATWGWFEYEPARWMVPLQPVGGVNTEFALGPLATLRSHGSTDARTWPLLSQVGGSGGAALRRCESTPLELIDSFANRPPLFMQVQALQRGAAVGAHVDEADVGGRCIATTVIYGESVVRVGGVSFMVRAGDCYALQGAARDDVDHEVYTARADRLSVTVRYGHRYDAHASSREECGASAQDAVRGATTTPSSSAAAATTASH